MKSAADINLLTAKQINAMTYRDLAPIGFNHLRDQALSALTLKDERDKLAAENERAFQMLECLGVPQERAKTVSNGIDVYATRMNRAAQDAEQKLSAIERAAGALPEEPEPDLDGLPWTHWASPEVVKYVKKLRLSATALAADAARWQYLRTRINYEDGFMKWATSRTSPIVSQKYRGWTHFSYDFEHNTIDETVDAGIAALSAPKGT